MNMLVLADGGRERAEREYQMLLGEAGFILARFVPTAAPASLVRAIPA